LPPERREPGEEIRRVIDGGEIRCRLAAVALRNPGDDRFLGREIAIEIAGAHPGFGADFLHRSLMKARAGEAALCRLKDLGAAVGLQLRVGAAHFTCAVR
jgi:hypothetical protein